MEHRNDERAALLPPGGSAKGHWQTRRNEDILDYLGLTSAQIHSLNERSDASGEDALVVYCREQGIASLIPLLP